MTRTSVGVAAGAVLGLLDGASAWAYPEARGMMLTIVVGSTLKGVLTGAACGWLARRWSSLPGGILAGIAIGFILSSLAAIPAGDPSAFYHIVLPGMLLGAIVGFVTQRYPAPVRSRGTAIGLLVVAMVGGGGVLRAQQPAADPFQSIAFLLGRWEGTSEGRPGKGTLVREYTRALNARFIRVHNRNTYPPQEKNPKGEVHEDEGFFSFDRARQKLVLRQFHVEGFVNQYVNEATSSATSVTFTSESIENIPPGWRARETYVTHSPDDVEEVFELAEPGKEFEVYSRARLRRIR